MSVEELDRMSEKARRKYLEIIRAIPLGRGIEITAEFCDATRELVLGAIKLELPNASEKEIRREYARRVLPEDLVKKVYG